MKCILCKGRGKFYVDKYQEEFDIFIGQGSYRGHENCPRCKGKGAEPYILFKNRLRILFESYGKYYNQYFKSKDIAPHHKEILNNI